MSNELSLLKASKKIVALALPMAGSQFISVASGFLCMTMLAKLGHQVLAASALIVSTQMSIMVTCMSILFSLSVLIGHAYGAQNYKNIGTFLQQGWTLALIISLPVILLFWHMGSILVFFGQPKEIADISQTYFHTFIWAVIPGLLSTCNMQFGNAVHKKNLIFAINIVSIPILLMTAYALIFGKMGMPKMGVAGLGAATAIEYSFFFIVSTLAFYFQKSFAQFTLFQYRAHHHLEHFAQIFKIGWPMTVQMGGEMLSFFVSAILIGWLGITALAAFQIVNQYYFLIVIPIFALSQASGILTGHACGAKQFHEIKKLSLSSIGVALTACLIATILFLIFPKQLASFYMDINNPENAATLHLTILIFMVIAFSQVFDALRHTLTGILRGLFDTRFAMIASLLTIWLIGMPVSYLLAFPLHFGAVGFVLGGMIGMMGCIVAVGWRWYEKVYLNDRS